MELPLSDEARNAGIQNFRQIETKKGSETHPLLYAIADPSQLTPNQIGEIEKSAAELDVWLVYKYKKNGIINPSTGEAPGSEGGSETPSDGRSDSAFGVEAEEAVEMGAPQA
jgi:hypothetical protein